MSQWEKDGVRRGETIVPLPAAKVAETRLFQGISIPHHDRKSLPQTEPIKIWAWIKISKACQMASPHHRGLSAVDASSEGDEECLILIHPQHREGGVFVERRYYGLCLSSLSAWRSSLSGIWVSCRIGRDKRSLFQICPKVLSPWLWSMRPAGLFYAIEVVDTVDQL